MINTLQWYLMYSSVLVVNCFIADLTSKKEAYCGTKLTNILADFCLAYYSPPEHRQKRQIITECCHNKCSLDYLLENYCKTVDTVALENFKSHGDERQIETTSLAPQLRNRRLSLQEERNLIRQQDSEVVPKKWKVHRKKRNCSCKNKHKIKKLKKTIKLLKKILLRERIRIPSRLRRMKDHHNAPQVVRFHKK